MLSFTKKEIALIKKLNTPAKVQDFLDKTRFNFEEDGKDVLKSPIKVLREKNCHCTEGAIFAAYVLSLHGYKPLILHCKVVRPDFDHVVALFKRDGYWGAISKTNHSVLRYREPVYKNIRELVMSYFHEYYLDNGKKTLRSYSRPLDLNIFGKKWAIAEHDLWEVDDKLDEIKHYEIVTPKMIKNFRKADKIEIEITKIVEYKKKKYNKKL